MIDSMLTSQIKGKVEMYLVNICVQARRMDAPRGIWRELGLLEQRISFKMIPNMLSSDKY